MIYSIGRGLLRFIYTVLFRLEAVGRENIPRDGGVVLCCNHISNYDPPTLGIKIERKVRFMAKSELFDIPVLGPVLKAVGAFPVKREASARNRSRRPLTYCETDKCSVFFHKAAATTMEELARRGSELRFAQRLSSGAGGNNR